MDSSLRCAAFRMASLKGSCYVRNIIWRMLKNVALVELFLCWIVWSLAFVKPRKQAARQKEVARAPASKWGIGLVMLSFALTWAYVHPVGFEKSEAVVDRFDDPGSSFGRTRLGGDAASGQAVAVSSGGERRSRTDPDGPLPLGSASDLCIDAGHAAGDRSRLDLVADVCRGDRSLSNRDRDSHSL